MTLTGQVIRLFYWPAYPVPCYRRCQAHDVSDISQNRVRLTFHPVFGYGRRRFAFLIKPDSFSALSMIEGEGSSTIRFLGPGFAIRFYGMRGRLPQNFYKYWGLTGVLGYDTITTKLTYYRQEAICQVQAVILS